MNKTIYTIALMASISCAYGQTPAQNETKAEDKLDTKKSEVKQAQRELDAAYIPFKKDAEVQIKANDEAIKELRRNLVKPGRSAANDDSKKKIDALEDRNVELRSRLYTYEAERSDWEAFRIKFNHDRDDLHKAVKDFGKDMKKQ
jgi:hypothetical protein